jgi:phenylacetate-CoA ligase
MKRVPYLTKDDFREHFKEFMAININIAKLTKGHTSGTSGKPIQFYSDTDIKERELAFIFHQWFRVGYKPGDPLVQIRGPIIRNSSLFEYNPAYKILRLSPRISNTETAEYYLKLISKFKAAYIHGYPSAIASFASLIKKNTLEVPFKLKAIFFASETVYDWERDIVFDVFNCRIFSHYGMAEQVVLASECENSCYYHCVPQYGITEIDPKTNEIIGTGFLNYVNPFIRYRTTDIASNLVASCDCSGREYYPVFMRVEGRLEDYIVTSLGLISPAIITHPFKDLKTIKNTQIIQKSMKHSILRVVPWKNSSTIAHKEELENLKQQLNMIIGDDMHIDIEETIEIEREKSGKFKWIISEVSKDILERGI